jgi:hypothetical protein
MSEAYQSQATGTDWAKPKPSASNPSPPNDSIELPQRNGTEGLMVALEQQMSTFAFEEQRSFERLRKEYIFDDPERVRAFLKTHRALFETLIEAVPFLRGAFGQDVALQLQVFWEEEPEVIRSVVLWKGSLTAAQERLSGFDEKWWLRKSQTSSERLVFDYQLV